MKKLVSLLSALMVAAFVGCAAEDSTSTPAPTTPTPSATPGGMDGTEAEPATPGGETPSTPDAGETPSGAGETPAGTPESSEAPGTTETP